MKKGTSLAAAKRQQMWIERWRHLDEQNAVWHTSEPPQELQHLLGNPELKRSAVVDLGCGGGTVTAFLSEHFDMTVGIDIAEDAIRQARALVAKSASSAEFIVADAAKLPIGSNEFSLVFDRGCLQNLPKEAWVPYLNEVTRVLAPGGFAQIFSSRLKSVSAPIFSPAGLKRRVARLRAERRVPRITMSELLRRAAPELVAVESRTIPFILKDGSPREWVYAVFRKPEPSQ